MLPDVIIDLAILVGTELVVMSASYFANLWKNRKMPPSVSLEMNETEEKKIAETQELVRKYFDQGIAETLKNASNRERISIMTGFADELAECYGLEDITIDIYADPEIASGGFYFWEKKEAIFNIVALLGDGDHVDYAKNAELTVKAVIHELRHAVQGKVLEDSDFWNIASEKRLAWAENLLPGNYIDGKVNYKGYCLQPVERDAFGFTNMVMEGV